MHGSVSTLLARVAMLGVGLVMLALGGGCNYIETGPAVRFRNESDAWITVRYHAGDRALRRDDVSGWVQMVSEQREVLSPRQEITFHLDENSRYSSAMDPVVRFQVAARGPSFEADPPLYWIELVSVPPCTIIASGRRDQLKFAAVPGVLVDVPESLWTRVSANGPFTLP